jgi:hypothetical protein
MPSNNQAARGTDPNQKPRLVPAREGWRIPIRQPKEGIRQAPTTSPETSRVVVVTTATTTQAIARGGTEHRIPEPGTTGTTEEATTSKEVILEDQEMRDTEAVTRGADLMSTEAAEPPVGVPTTTEKRIKLVFFYKSRICKYVVVVKKILKNYVGPPLGQ